MNSRIYVLTACGHASVFALDARTFGQNLGTGALMFGPTELLALMQQLHRAGAITKATSIELLPMESSGAAHPVEWNYPQRLAATSAKDGPPLAVVRGYVDEALFVRVVDAFFGTPAVVGIDRA